MPLKIHFLNVGQGDCTVIEFPSGRLALVDINNGKTLDASTRDEVLAQYRATRATQQQNNLVALANLLGVMLEQNYLKQEEAKTTDPIAYLDHWLLGRDFFRVVITHPDMDHMTGLHRLYIQTGRRIDNFWHSGPHEFNLATTTAQEWADCPYDKRDWDTYKALRASANNSPTSLRLYSGQQGHFWTDDGVEILAPSAALEKKAVELDQPNIISMAFMITYAGRRVVVGGDATADESWPDICSRVALPIVSVLKASHHGRKSGYHQPAVKALSPWLTITSVGQTEHDATESYRQYSDYTVSLRDAGDIRITINDDGQWYCDPDLSHHWKPKKTQVGTPPPPRPPWLR